MVGIEVLDHDEREAMARGHRGKKRLERFQPAGGCPDSHDGEAVGAFVFFLGPGRKVDLLHRSAAPFWLATGNTVTTSYRFRLPYASNVGQRQSFPARPARRPVCMVTAAPAETRHPARVLWAAAVAVGVAWGGSQLLSKIAISTGHDPAGVTLVEAALAAAITSVACLLRGRRLPLSRAAVLFYLACGLFGSALPGTLNYTTLQYLPVGVVSILVAAVPMLTMLIGAATGSERLSAVRCLGIALGAGAVVMIALPDAAVPGVGQALWVMLGLAVALSYAIENTIIDIAAPPGADALTLMTGMSWAAFAMLVPLVWMRDGWVDLAPMGVAERAILGVAVVHLVCYTSFVWLVKAAGPVFAAQIGYVVTISAVLWGMAVLGERHAGPVWLSLALMLAGMALVQPRDESGRHESGRHEGKGR